jgi:LDH2 family malate/lactate/ureidoglycolate dehydrogenase
VIAELFAAFTGNAGVTSQDVHSAMGNAATFVAIDPRAFSTEDDLEDRIASLTAYLRETTPSSNISTGIAATDEVGLLPGEPEHRTRCDCLKRGIDIDERVVKTLRDLAVDLGLESSLPDVMRNP